MSVSSTFDLFRTIQGAVEPAGSWQCEDRVLTPTSLRRKKERGEEAVVGVLAMRQTSPATSLRRKSPWRRRSRAASGGRHRGLRAPRSASMAWALRAKRLRRASNPVRFEAARLHDSADFSRSIGRFPSRFFCARWKAKAKDGPFPFALGGKGLASAAGAANARNKIRTTGLVCMCSYLILSKASPSRHMLE